MFQRIVIVLACFIMVGCGASSPEPAAPDPQVIAQAVAATVDALPKPEQASPVEVTRVVEVTREVQVEVTREVEVTRVVEVTAVPEPTATLEPTATPEPTAVPAPTVATKQSAKRSPEQVLEAFRAAGLEAEGVTPLTKDDYGMAPYVGSGFRFLIPSLGEDSGGRVFAVENKAEREQLRQYYEELGKASALFFSWVFVDEANGILVQINGDLPEDQAKRYQAVVEN